MIIGADGIGSLVRKHVLGHHPPISAKYTGWLSLGCVLSRSQVELPADMQLPAFFYTRAGTILAFAPDEHTIQWATSTRVPERDRHDWQEFRSSGQAVAQLQAEWGGITMEPIRSMIRHLETSNLRLWAPYEIPDLPRWHTARTCILGDAAHAVPPSLGQGAAQAFEDVGIMTRLLSNRDLASHEDAFARFEAIRRPRVDMVRKMTAKAESNRGATTSGLGWYIKSSLIRGAFMVLGKGKESYMQGREIGGYDPTTDVDVQG